MKRDITTFLNKENEKKTLLISRKKLYATAKANLNGNCWLIISCRREDLTLFGRDNSVPLNKFGHDTTNCFNTKSQRIHI